MNDIIPNRSVSWWLTESKKKKKKEKTEFGDSTLLLCSGTANKAPSALLPINIKPERYLGINVRA